MSKPIEPGCLAIVVGNPKCGCADCARNKGKKVVVGNQAGMLLSMFANAPMWEVTSLSGPLVSYDLGSGKASEGVTAFIPEPFLQRIDDPDGEDEVITRVGKPEGVTT